MLWWLAKARPRRARLVPARLDGSAYGLRILGRGQPRAKRFGTIISAIRNGVTEGQPAARSELLRDEIRTIGTVQETCTCPQRTAVQAGAVTPERRDGRPAAGTCRPAS
jgi:hypothetical protein